MKTILIVALTLILALSGVALAGNNPQAKVAVHVRPHDAKLGCDYGTINTCQDLIVTEPGFNVDAFPVFFDLSEFQGCQYGMWWPGWAYSGAFSNCADLVIGDITWPGDGASHTWLSCRTGLWVCVPSFIWLYADGPGMVCVIPHPISGMASVLDCAEGLDEAFVTICAGVYGYVGDDPCPPVATSPGTWGEIKGVFE
jgi:hypothetical protein